FKIGELYGFKILVKTEESQKEGSMFKDNRFFIEGEGNIKYSYNNGHIATDPLLASTNFLKALDRIPVLIDKYQSDNQKLEKDLPVLKEVMDSVWKKEPELKELKSQLDSLSRQINLNLENKDKNQGQVTDVAKRTQTADIPKMKDIKPEAAAPNKPEQPEAVSNIRSGRAMSIKDIVEANPGRIIIAKPDTGNTSQDGRQIEQRKRPAKGFGI
ncbi:hypothetical protein SAMN05444362_1151, partial [Dysgonomonas macrotermitis]